MVHAKRNAALALAVGITLAACATTTPYQPASQSGGYGFSDQRIEENRYRITFRGNSSTTREQVEDSLLYRAAEVTLQNNYDYFLIVENNTEAKKSYTTSGSALYGHYGFGSYFYPFPYYAYGWGWGFPYESSYTTELTRYSAVAYVTLHKGAKPSDNPQAFDARQVIDSLRSRVLAQPKK